MRRADTVRILGLSFLLPALVLLTAFAAMGMAPFGDKSALIMDMSYQYVEFLCGLRYGDGSISWSKALGSNYIGVFAYYLSSPLSILTLFFPCEQMPLAVLFLTVLKVGLCGLSFSLLLLYKFKRPRFAVVLFSLFYGLMAYNVAYSLCIMWLDVVFWLPVIVLGLERLLNGKGTGLLGAALFLSFLSNYYLSYMAGLFSVLYFFYRCLEERLTGKQVLRYLGKFALSAGFAAALGAFLLLPTLASLFQGKLSEQGADYGGFFNFTLVGFLYKLLPGSYDSLTNTGAPFLYCGAVPMVLFPSFFFLRKFSRRSRCLTAALALLLFLSLWLSPLDKVWHVFQYPNWYPYRYAFTVSFFVILTAYRVFDTLHLTARSYVAVLAVFSVLDLFGNSLMILRGLDEQFGYDSNSEYRTYKQEVSGLLSQTNEDDDFFRVGATAERSKNDAIGFGYNGITHFSSAYNESVNRLLKQLGFAQGYFWSSYFGSTAVTDALFDVRYVISARPVVPSYSLEAVSNFASIYKNPDALSVGMAVNGNALAQFAFADNPFDSQNRLVRALTGTDRDCFLPQVIDRRDGAGETIIRFISSGEPVYGEFTGSGDGWLFVDGVMLTRLFSNETRCIQYLGCFEAGREVEIRVQADELYDADIRYLDTAAWEDAVSRLGQSTLTVDSYDNRRLTGTVTATDGDVLFTTIPYDKGWSVRVDGRKTETAAFQGTLLFVPLGAGEHEIEMVYTAPGMVPGLCLSFSAALLLTGGYLLRRRKRAMRTEPPASCGP